MSFEVYNLFSRSTASKHERDSCLTIGNVENCDKDKSGQGKWSKCTRPYHEELTNTYVQHRSSNFYLTYLGIEIGTYCLCALKTQYTFITIL